MMDEVIDHINKTISGKTLEELTGPEKKTIEKMINYYIDDTIARLNPAPEEAKRIGHGIEWALRMVDELDDPNILHWKKVAIEHIFAAPSPLMDQFRKLAMGHDEKESIRNIDEWSN